MDTLARPAALPAPVAAPTPQAVFVDGKERPISTGGKIFDLLTYGGLAGVGVFLITIPIANLFMREDGPFHGFDQWLRKSARKLGASENIANQFANTTHTMHGGNLILLPVAMMEKFRTPIVNALNRAFKDPTDPKSVEDSPPQTLGSIVKGRIVAWLTVFSAFTGVSMAIGEKRFEGLLDQAGNKLCEMLKKPVMEFNKKGVWAHSKTYNIGRTGALDFLATASAATLLYITSHYFANSEARQRHRRKDADKRVPPSTSYSAAHAHTDQLDVTESPEKPSVKVSHVAHEAAISRPLEHTAQL